MSDSDYCPGGNTHDHTHYLDEPVRYALGKPHGELDQPPDWSHYLNRAVWLPKEDEPQHLIISNRPARRRWYGRRVPASTVTFGPSSDRQAAAEFAAREMTAGNVVYVATGFAAMWRESRVA